MVNRNCDLLTLPASVFKTKHAITIPLVGIMEPIAVRLRAMRAALPTFPAANQNVFDFTNFRKRWNQACHDLGFGKFDKKTCNYEGLIPHDFRRSAARNLIDAGLSEQEAMLITGHKTREIFRRYNIMDQENLKQKLIKAKEK